jgi:hypothetical protein
VLGADHDSVSGKYLLVLCRVFASFTIGDGGWLYLFTAR